MEKRQSGLIIHPTSFTSNYGCGDLGEGAYKVLDWLKKAGQSILQILAIGPTGFGDSPYAAFSAFAGTPYIISFDKLLEKGYLKKSDLDDYPKFHPSRVDYYGIYINNFKILRKAYERFKEQKKYDDFEKFSSVNNYWLNDYGLFMAIKESYNGAPWDMWDEDIRNRKNLDKLPEDVKDTANFYKFIQWEFHTQWHEFKKYAEKLGITIIGDVPIFVNYDSSDVWGNQHLFHLDKNGKPTIVAGVPPDYFSETGQLWGNPHYRWDIMEQNDFDWWKKRLKNLLQLVDVIKIDHFRGFEAYWEVKFGEKTAMQGQWVKAPGQELFNSFKKEFGDKLQHLVIAEDLGVITEEVKELRDSFGFPGMRIFEFANFKATKKSTVKEKIDEYTHNAYLPENYIENCIAYPGTHDNDTLHGWFHSLSSEGQKDVLDYLGETTYKNLNTAVINKLMNSKANTVGFLVQDILGLTSDSRLNTPGTLGIHNWTWRLLDGMLTDEVAEKLYNITKESGRI